MKLMNADQGFWSGRDPLTADAVTEDEAPSRAKRLTTIGFIVLALLVVD